MENEELLSRGTAKVIPEDLAEAKLASKEKLRIYLGIDPTGPHLHLGHTVPLRKLQKFADNGHHAIFLVGSYTAMIGDPSGQDKMRDKLSKKEVEKNFETYKEQASKVLDFTKVEIRYNHEWLEKLTTKEIFEISSHFTLQQIQQRDIFQKRDEEGNPAAMYEVFYPLMVAYDSVMLDVDCELGGTDQEFNMLCGRKLQKVYGKREKFVLTTPLIEGADGRKMSKTYNNCIYIDDEPNDMYGKAMSINDDLVDIYAECCTDLAIKEKPSNPRDAKAWLAHEIVRMYHGDKQADQAQEEFNRIFAGGGVPDDMPEASASNRTILDIIVDEKLAPSRSEARRLIEQGGVKLDDTVIDSPDTAAQAGILKVGKRKFIKLT
jgi:tyrosyl-tRNA synthetase